jgi:HEXXH motif-containing protein
VAPQAAERVFRYPAVGAWAIQTARQLNNGEASLANPERLSVVAAAAAIHAKFPYRTTTNVVGCGVVIPSLGRALFNENLNGREAVINVTTLGAEVVVARSRVALPDEPLNNRERWQGIRPLKATASGLKLQLLLDDIDPHRFEAVHNPSARLAASDVMRWNAMFQQAWRLLVQRHRRVADEVRSMLVTLTPLDTPLTSQGRSATSRDNFGCVALSQPPESLTFAVTLAHEIQHSKLTALLDLVEFVRPTADAVYYAPWRNDPRPAQALLHGAYAYLGVAAFWRLQRHPYRADLIPHREYVRWRQAVGDTIEVLLTSNDLTDLGRRFVEGMRHTLRSWQMDRVPPAAEDLARTAADSHRARWHSTHGHHEGSKSQSNR